MTEEMWSSLNKMKRNKKTKNIISQYWNGEIPLVKSFWIVAVVILGIVSIPSYLIDDQTIYDSTIES